MRPLFPPETLSPSEYEYPYRYYEITLIRSRSRMDMVYKKKLDFLGLTKRNHVTWWLVHPFSASKILEVRHLIGLRLTNHIPKEILWHTPGYALKTNILNDRYSSNPMEEKNEAIEAIPTDGPKTKVGSR